MSTAKSCQTCKWFRCNLFDQLIGIVTVPLYPILVWLLGPCPVDTDKRFPVRLPSRYRYARCVTTRHPRVPAWFSEKVSLPRYAEINRGDFGFTCGPDAEFHEEKD